MREPKAGDLRVWWNRLDGKSSVYVSVPTKEIAVGVLYGLAQGDLNNPNVGANAGGMEVYEDIEDGNGLQWNEWYDDETGVDIDGYAEENFPSLNTIK